MAQSVAETSFEAIKWSRPFGVKFDFSQPLCGDKDCTSVKLDGLFYTVCGNR